MGEITEKFDALCDSYETEIMDHLNAISNVVKFARITIESEDSPIQNIAMAYEILKILEDYVTSEVY